MNAAVGKATLWQGLGPTPPGTVKTNHEIGMSDRTSWEGCRR